MISRQLIHSALCAVFFLSLSNCKSRGGSESATKTATSKGFHYDRISVTVLSSDNKPVEGVEVAFQLDAIRFQWSDPHIYTPGFKPGYYDSYEKSGTLGRTNSEGKIEITDITYESKYKKPSRIWFFADEDSNVYCEPGSSVTNNTRFYRVKTGAIKGKTAESSDQLARCGAILLHDENDPKELHLECVTARSQAEIINDMKADKAAACP